jgi:multiple sugar transport system substrate-binding protein
MLGTAAAIAAPAGLARPASAQAVSLTAIHALPPNMYQAVTRRFVQEHPQIDIRLEPAAQTYEELTLRVLRGAATNMLPDIAFQGLNRVKMLRERDLGTPLDTLVGSGDEWARLGYLPSMLDLGRVDGRAYGLPFAVSTPVVYYNADLVRRAGGDPDRFPSDWDAIIDLGRRIKALGTDTLGIHFEYYNVSGNWTFIALVQSHGGRMATPDDRDVAFDSAEGLRSLEVMRKAGEVMVDISHSQALQAFIAGTLGIFVASSANNSQIEAEVARRFDARSAPFPLPSPSGRLPAGGAVSMMLLTRDPAKIAAAWEYMKFATGPVGQTIMVHEAGYCPGNSLAVNDPNLLGNFYADHPLHMTSIHQLPVMTGWYAFPGANSVRITDVIRGHLQTVVLQRGAPEQVLRAMARDVRALLT